MSVSLSEDRSDSSSTALPPPERLQTITLKGAVCQIRVTAMQKKKRDRSISHTSKAVSRGVASLHVPD
jgi:hypothetical protein